MQTQTAAPTECCEKQLMLLEIEFLKIFKVK
jgi:hypothetical protein